MKYLLYSFLVLLSIAIVITLHVLMNFFGAIASDCSAPAKISLQIETEAYDKISAIREKALVAERLLVGKKDWVAGKFIQGVDTHKVDLRLKGDHPDHFAGERWSFRIKTRKKHPFRGMHRFSIQDPVTRKGLGEWHFHKLLEHEQLPYLLYDFVEVSINNENKGIYAIEEHFSTSLMERLGLPPSVIIRFDESGFWGDDYLEYRHSGAYDTTQYVAAKIDAFQSKRISRDSLLSNYFTEAERLLNGFRNGQLKASQVFDIETTARYFAITDLTGAWHANRWHNKRWYYHPEIGRLIPIGFDADSDRLKTPEWLTNQMHKLNRMHWDPFFEDPAIRQAYHQALTRISQPAWLEAFFETTQAEFNCHSRTFLLNNIDLNLYETRARLRHNAEIIRKYVAEQGLL